MNKKCIIIVPHFDDEIFQTGALLLKYKHEIELFITHPNDVLSLETYSKQISMFNKSMEIINDYRIKHGLEKIEKIHYYPYADFNGTIQPEYRRTIQTDIENAFVCNFDEYNKQNETNKLYDTLYEIDYWVTTELSTHQSHRGCNDIAVTSLRSPYIEKCKNVLFATYPQSEFGICYDTKQNINSYIILDDTQVDIMCHCIGNIYGEKNFDSTILGADNFRKYLFYFGSKCGKKYAQPFTNGRHIMTLNMN